MKLIVAVDKDWGIGFKGQLLQRIPEDMKFFKSTTLGKVVVMGRETFESLPGKEPLKDRVNIVLSKNPAFINHGITICRSLEELFKELEKYKQEDVFVIGGESIYLQLHPYCSQAYVTKIQDSYVADKYFMDMDNQGDWKIVEISEVKEHQRIKFNFVRYEKCEEIKNNVMKNIKNADV